jgi:hypothetical protein
MKLLRTGWLLLLAVGAAGFILAASLPDRPVQAAPLPNPDSERLALRVTPKYDLPKNVKFTGMSSCAAASCHGSHSGEVPNTLIGTEHRFWVANDPHWKAYRVLFNEVSTRMAKALNHRDPSGKPIPAHEDTVCLRCHGLNATKTERTNYTFVEKEPYEKLVADASLADGVSCESCHGPAEKWLDTHYQAGFKELSREVKANKYGLYPTKDLNFRVQMCASCHIGHTAGEDVNHDLYAAGHPRLAWEYTMHDTKYPKHFTEKAYGTDFQARAWAIGQIASLRSAIQLTLHRAEESSKSTPWPEFSEYSCFSCHRSLEPDLDPKKLGKGGRGLGVLPWNTLFRPTFDLLASQGGVFFSGGKTPSLDAVRQLIKKMEPAKSNEFAKPADVVSLAPRAIAELDSWLLDLQAAADRDTFASPIPPAELQKFYRLIAEHNLDRSSGQLKFKDADWDNVASHHMSLMSLYYGSVELDKGYRNPGTVEKLSEIRNLLRFTRDFRQPLNYSPSKVLTAFDGLLK